MTLLIPNDNRHSGRGGRSKNVFLRPKIRILLILLVGAIGAAYWGYGYFRLSLDPEWGSGFEGDLPWLGAESPSLVVHEYFDYECPHCLSAHKKLRRKLRRHPERLRIVRHDYARMSCRLGDNDERASRCTMVRAAYCAGRSNKYWEWNDAVIENPKPPSGESRSTFELELAREMGFDPVLFEKCLHEKSTIDAAEAIFREARQNGIKGTPYYIARGRRMTSREVLDFIEASLR